MPQHNKKKKHRNKRNTHPDINSENSNGEGSENQQDEENEDEDQNNNETNDEAYAMKHSDIFGRYLVASRDLKAGEIVIEVPPIVIGPCADSDPICLGCHSDFTAITKVYKCPGCGWRICSAKCSGLKKDGGHSTWECTALREHRVADYLDRSNEVEIKQMYEAVLSLRCLLLKQNNKEAYDRFIEMEPHNDIRKNIPALWKRNQEAIVNRIRIAWKFPNFTDEEIHTVCGILEVNSFEVGQNNVRARALFPSAYLLAHDCTPNTTHTDDPLTHALTIRVTNDVKKGDMITLCYSYTLQGTIKRREHLNDCKFFWCQCKRCADPTEFGTYCSALQCPKCNGGLILTTNPLDQEASWKCNSCNYTVTAKSILLLVGKLFLELDELDADSIDDMEEFIKKYRNVLHQNHYLFLSAKHSLCQLYGRTDGKMIQNMSLEELKHKETLCRDLLKVVDKFEPGLSRLRGVIMYELHAPVMIQATRLYESKQIASKDLKKKLKEVVQLLTDCEKILSFEPEGSQEHSMTMAARDALKRIGIF